MSADSEERLGRVEQTLGDIQRAIRDHDMALAELQKNQALHSELLNRVTSDFRETTAQIQSLGDRLRNDEITTADYRQGQAFKDGRLAGIGMLVVFLVGFAGSIVSTWLEYFWQK